MNQKLLLTALASIFFFSANYTTTAQIIYTDVIPDSTKTNFSNLTIDLDNDNVGDFMIESQLISSLGYVSLKGGLLGLSNYVLENNTGSPLALNYGDSIGPNCTVWKQMNGVNQQMAGYAGGTAGGTWPGVGDRYLGFKFLIGSNYHYGWARLNVSSSSVMYTLYDYAYESSADTKILAGHKGLAGVNETKNENTFAMFPNPANNVLNICANSTVKKIEFYSLQGQLIKSFSPELNEKKIAINISELSSGVYFIKTITENTQEVKKLTIAK